MSIFLEKMKEYLKNPALLSIVWRNSDDFRRQNIAKDFYKFIEILYEQNTAFKKEIRLLKEELVFLKENDLNSSTLNKDQKMILNTLAESSHDPDQPNTISQLAFVLRIEAIKVEYYINDFVQKKLVLQSLAHSYRDAEWRLTPSGLDLVIKNMS